MFEKSVISKNCVDNKYEVYYKTKSSNKVLLRDDVDNIDLAFTLCKQKSLESEVRSAFVMCNLLDMNGEKQKKVVANFINGKCDNLIKDVVKDIKIDIKLRKHGGEDVREQIVQQETSNTLVIKKEMTSKEYLQKSFEIKKEHLMNK